MNDPAERIGALIRSGRHANAERVANHAVNRDPADFRIRMLRALARFHLRRLDGALDDARSVLKVAPEFADGWRVAGLVLEAMDRPQEALRAFERASLLQPEDVEAWFRGASLRRRKGDWDAAIRGFQTVVRLQPDAVAGWVNLGLSALDANSREIAVEAFERARDLLPENGEILLHLGRAYRLAGRLDQARITYEQALQAGDVDRAGVLNNLGVVVGQLGNDALAIQYFDQALQERPGFLDAELNRLVALGDRMQPSSEDALRVLERARSLTRLHPNHPGVWTVLATLNKSRPAVALQCYRRAVALGGSRATLLVRQLFRAACVVFDWSDYETLRLEVLRGASVDDGQYDMFGILSIEGIDLRTILTRSRFVARRDAAAAALRLCDAPEPVHHGAVGTSRSLKIGLLSGDLREHPMARIVVGVVEHLDRARFETIAYATAPPVDTLLGKRVVAAFDRFADVSAESAEDVARRIHSDRIDILIDASGYTDKGRSAVLAFRPAPLQVAYAAFPATMGAEHVDYVVADATVIPESDRPFYDESVAWLPDSYFPRDDRQPVAPAPSRASQGLPEDAVVLCSFNQASKVTPRFFDIWCRVLANVPDAVLWVFAPEDLARENLRREAGQRGIDPARLCFAGPMPNADHLARIALADLMLDTLPYNAHTTAADALWVGVPVVTCEGNTFAGRVGSSLLRAQGLPELITANLDDYERLVTELARDRERLEALRATVLERRDQGRLFDTARYTRNLEALLVAIWERREAGLPPAPLRVGEDGSTEWLA